MQTVLYSDDINLLSHWKKSLDDNTVSLYDLEELNTISNSIVVLNYSSFKAVCETILKVLIQNNNRILVLDRTPELDTAKKLLKLGVMGYGNAMMRGHFIVSALDALKENMIWLHPEITSKLIMEIPSTDNNNEELLSRLTSREREVSLLLKDALTYNDIAQQLNISPRTVKAHAQAIYTKLNVKDKIGLALLLK